MTGRIQLLRRARWEAIAFLGTAFVVGALVGGAFERVRLARAERPVPWGPHAGAGDAARRFDRIPRRYERLGLSAEQRARIEAIFERRRPQTDSILTVLMPRLRTIIDSVRAEIHHVLTPAQRAQLESDLARLRERGPLPPRSPAGTSRWPGSGDFGHAGLDPRVRPPGSVCEHGDGRLAAEHDR